MKFWTPAIAGAALVTAVTAQRGVDIVNEAVAQISDATVALSEGIAAFEGPDQAIALLNVSNGVLEVIRAGTANVTRAPLIDGLEALELTPPVLNLSRLVNSSVQIVIDKKPVFANYSLVPVVLMSLQQQQCASQQFNNASASRLPQGGIQLVAYRLSAPILQALANGIAVYTDANSTTMNQPVTCEPVNSTGYILDVPRNAAPATGVASSIVVAWAAALAIVMLA